MNRYSFVDVIGNISGEDTLYREIVFPLFLFALLVLNFSIYRELSFLVNEIKVNRFFIKCVLQNMYTKINCYHYRPGN